MDENLKLVPICDLLGKNFFIPRYQRGYRWTEQQVKDLLDDIEEFIASKPNANDFYCLQPLVVKDKLIPNEESAQALANDKNWIDLKKNLDHSVRWEVIDGQQRLTTIYILLTYLGYGEKYSIVYDTREQSARFLDEIEKQTPENAQSNIDFFHMAQAYETINKWFDNKNEDFKTTFKDTLLNKVQFIWFKSDDPDPIAVFTRLNIGKIPLTNAELIKAMMLNRSNWKNGETKSLALRQSELALQWDEIEYTLQNDEFWMFFHDKGFDKPTRIELLLDWIQEDDELGLFQNQDDNAKHEAIGTDQHKTFRYFYHFFYKADVNSEENRSKIERAWSKVREKFDILKEWYNDCELYHYIGYLLIVPPKISVKALLTKFTTSPRKKDFINTIKEEIRKKIQNFGFNKNYNDNERKNCVPLLLLFNIQTVVAQNQNYCANQAYTLPAFYRFPFHLYKSETWNVEHIDSNTTNEVIDYADQKEWICNAWYDLQNKIDNKLKKKLFTFCNNQQKRNFTTLQGELLKFYSNSMKNPLNEQEKNQIWNFALLDEHTNKSYGNALFPAKRRILLGKDSSICYEFVVQKDNPPSIDITPNHIKGGIPFFPVCTKNVFSKFYTPGKNDSWVWDKEDAQNYQAAIKSILKDFLPANDKATADSGESNNE